MEKHLLLIYKIQTGSYSWGMILKCLDNMRQPYTGWIRVEIYSVGGDYKLKVNLDYEKYKTAYTKETFTIGVQQLVEKLCNGHIGVVHASFVFGKNTIMCEQNLRKVRFNMRQSPIKLLALFGCVSLFTAALFGCSKSMSDSDTDKQAYTQQEPENEVFTFPLPDGPEEADIYIEPIPNISDDFIRGMDASIVQRE